MTKHHQISADVPDWTREKANRWWAPAARVLQSIRDYQRYSASGNPIHRILKMISVIRHRFWGIVAASDIPLNCNIAGGLRLTHPNGVVIHPKAEIGPNCLILQQVTIVRGVILEGHVDIGAGAKIVKPIRVGKHATIGANAVVLSDVPAYATVVGIPARVVKIEEP